MLQNKQDFIKSFLSDDITDVNFAQLDLDITDLSIGDILRNANVTYPINSRLRNKMINGTFAVAILCKSELLDPLNGLLLIITNDETPIEIISKNYIVIGISESRITNEPDIKEVIDKITKYMITNFKDSFEDFNQFYVKYIYDDYEYIQEQER